MAFLNLFHLPSWGLQTLWGLGTGLLGMLRCLAARAQRYPRGSEAAPGRAISPAHAAGRLAARPGQPTGTARLGLQRLRLAWPCDGVLYVPLSYRADRPAPFLLMLHGADGVGLFGLWPIILFADLNGLIILAPDARGTTWDRIHGAFGADVAFLDRALAEVFGRYAIDPSRLAIGGFSDGASYALSLGLTNGDLFTEVLAFAPGFAAPGAPVGRPRILITHGSQDRVLPITCSLRLVSLLRQGGYDVTFSEFTGPHLLPPRIARQAVQWLLGRNRSLP